MYGFAKLNGSQFTWVANYNNVLPTPLDGAWDVAGTSGPTPAREVPSVVYFERNRAFMAVFRYASLRGDQLHLTGRFAGEGGPTTLVLARRRVAGSSGHRVAPRTPAR